jgi:hypothetical protein
MSRRVWRLAALVVAVICVAGAASAFARTTTRAAARTKHSGPLSGNWSGYIGSGSTRQRMQITVNSRETAGTWSISAGCSGTLTLDSISDGYHHFRRHVASGASCAGGDVDCLKRAGADLYDAVTSHLGGSWDTSGTLKRAGH